MFWLLELSDTLGLLYCRAFFKRFSFQLVCSRNYFRLDPQAVVSLGVLRPDPRCCMRPIYCAAEPVSLSLASVVSILGPLNIS